MTHPIVQEDIESIFKIVGDDLNRLRGKRVLITGGTGFIGTWLLETISCLNTNCNQPCKVYVPTRNPEAFADQSSDHDDGHIRFGAVFFYLFPVSIIGVVYGDQYIAAASILKYYGLAMLPMALLMVLMNYLIAREKNLFSCIMIVGALLEIFAIILFHDSLMQIVFIMLTAGTLLLATGIAIQFVPALQPNLMPSSKV